MNRETPSEDRLRIGLWNIDHPEHSAERRERSHRLQAVEDFLLTQHCDLYVITEANAAMVLDGYESFFSLESPFRSKGRDYGPPNRYHQVGIYSSIPFEPIEIAEPINGLLGRVSFQAQPLLIYGNVVTIKDQWLKTSNKKYSDRLAEQIAAFESLHGNRCLVAGDFNLKHGWRQKESAFGLLRNWVRQYGWAWPTECQSETVQQVLHSADLDVVVSIDHSVKHSHGLKDRLSDHPFVLIEATSSI